MMPLGEAALVWAASHVGVKESGGKNRGPEVNTWLANVHQSPGAPWCCAFAVSALMAGASMLGIRCTAPITASCLQLWSRSVNWQVAGNPRPGDVYVLDHGQGKGHVGIVETVDDLQVLTEISGNTNAVGSREGDRVARHEGPPERSHGGVLLGYLRFA
jgi:hypothetical protein